MKRKELLVILLISMMLTLIAGCTGPTVNFGFIDVDSTPSGARVYINGVDTGMVTPIVFTKEVGSYTIKLDLFHYKIWEGTVTVNADLTTYINAPLPYASTETITLQPGAEGKDAYVEQALPNDNGSSYEVYTGYTDTWKAYRTYLEFDLSPNPLPAGAVVSHVYLKLYQSSSWGSGSSTMGLYQVTSGWGEDSITWNNQPTSSSEVEASCTVYTTINVWRTWYDVGDLVRGWLDGSITNYGMLLKATTNETSLDIIAGYYSSDYTSDTSKRPKLEISYYIP